MVHASGVSAARWATVLLLALTAVWGSTFFLIKDLVQHVPSLDFLGVRFLIAAAIVTTLTWRRIRALGRRTVLRATVLGLLYALAQVLQTVGLETTPASVSGFITGMYVVLTPLFAAFVLRHRVAATTWVAVAIATGGLALLTMRGFSIGVGELLTLGCAIAYTWHILATARWASLENAIGMTGVQLWVIGIVCIVGGAPDGITLPSGGGQWASMLYMVVFASIAALWVQTWAQAQISATRTAILMTFEPVFAAAFAVGLGGEALTWQMVLGGMLVIVAMLGVELLTIRTTRRRETASTAPIRLAGE